MIDDNTYDNFYHLIDRVKQTKEGADKLLDDLESQPLKKQFIVDSFLVTKFHRDFKHWQDASKGDFRDGEISAYNKKLGQITRLDAEIQALQEDFELKRSQVILPTISVSRLSIKQYDETLLKDIDEDQTEIKIDEIFSLDGGNKPKIDTEIFKQIIDTEYRLRIERMIQYDILKKMKREILTMNQKWTLRNNQLNSFFSNQLTKVLKQVDEVRQAEFEEEEEEEEEEEIEHLNENILDNEDAGIEQEQEMALGEPEIETEQPDIEVETDQINPSDVNLSERGTPDPTVNQDDMQLD